MRCRTPLGELTALPDPLAGFEGPLRGSEVRSEDVGGKRGERDGGEGRCKGGRRGLAYSAPMAGLTPPVHIAGP